MHTCEKVTFWSNGRRSFFRRSLDKHADADARVHRQSDSRKKSRPKHCCARDMRTFVASPAVDAMTAAADKVTEMLRSQQMACQPDAPHAG